MFNKEKTTKNRTLLITTTAMLISVGILLPQIFHTVPNAGGVFLPMHVPVLLCGLICGPVAGALAGALTPVLSWAIFGMPPAPTALVPMIFELFVYGLVTGLCSRAFSKREKPLKAPYVPSLLIAMLCGRVISIIVKMILLSAIMGGNPNKVIIAALMGGFVTCWPGVLIQITFIPLLMTALDKAGILQKYVMPSVPVEDGEMTRA